MTMDLLNGLFETGGALITLLSVRQLLRDRQLRGAHWGPTVFFTAWGAWNLAYYPHLRQPVSTVGAALLVIVNVAYLALMLRFRTQKSGDPYEIIWGQPRVLSQPVHDIGWTQMSIAALREAGHDDLADTFQRAYENIRAL
jgi:hypothetical protein